MSKKTQDARIVVARLNRIIDEYKLEHPPKERDWRTYEQQYARRAKLCFAELEPMVEQAVSNLETASGEMRGNKSKLTLKEKLLLLLLKQICAKSNRSMEWMVVLFHWLSNIDVSYKTIERLYSDQAVYLAMHNLHVLILKKNGLLIADCCGDGTGYTVQITEHYATEARRRKDAAKTNDSSGKHAKIFYSFALMDIKTRLYIGFGSSFKSEKEAYEEALSLAKVTGIVVKSLRLDRYYSAEAYVNICQKALGKVKMYLIPKKNIASFGVGEWCRAMHRFLADTKKYLEEYFKRNQSESGFSEDKKRTGWRILQKRAERVETAITLNILWHNLFWWGA